MGEAGQGNGITRLDCASIRSFYLKYPFCVDSKVYTPVHSNALHNHDFPQLWYCLEGTYVHQIENQLYECNRGMLVVIPPGVLHKIAIPKDNYARILRLDIMFDVFLNAQPEKYINSITNLFLYSFMTEFDMKIPLCHILSTNSQRVIEDHLSWLAANSIKDPKSIPVSDVLDRLEAVFSLDEVSVCKLYRKRVVWLVQTRLLPVIQVLSYMNAHFSEKIKEDTLLQISATSRSALYRFFKQYSGYSCFEYLKWLRINRAFLYLTYTNHSLSYIADVCGFSDLPHMSRLFSKFWGSTPKVLRIKQQKWLDEHPHMSDSRNYFKQIL